MKHSLILSTFLLFFAVQTQAQFVLNGDAVATSDDCFLLTTSLPWQGGSVWHPTLINLDKEFAVRVELSFGTLDATGADGMAFLLQPISTGLGMSGGGMGYEGITPSLAVEFDTWQNIPFNDPANDHLSIQQNGNLDHFSALTLAGPVDISATSPNVEDGLGHSVLIAWDPITQTLDVEFDCDLRLSYTGDIVTNIFGGDPNVYIGFTGSTGGNWNPHEVCFEFLEVSEGPEIVQVCEGDTVLMPAPDDFSSYVWSPATGLSDPFIATPLAFPSVTTTYQLTFSDDCGNSFIDSFIVEVEPGPGPAVYLGEDSTICAGTTITLSDPTIGFGDLLWSDGSTGNSITVTEGTYWLEVTQGGVCSGSDTIVISEVEVAISLDASVPICPGDSTLIGVSPEAGWEYLWSNGNTDPEQWVEQPDSYTLNASFAGCEDEATINVDLSPLPVIMLPDSTGWCPDAVFQVIAGGNASSFSWSTGANGAVLQQVDGPGLVYVEGQLGTCFAVDSLIIYEEEFCDCRPMFPNAFTPNQDGMNDLFQGRALASCPFETGFSLSIYNRWGELLFFSDSQFAAWDGTFRGKDQEMGTYIWQATFNLPNEPVEQRSGTVTLIR